MSAIAFSSGIPRRIKSLDNVPLKTGYCPGGFDVIMGLKQNADIWYKEYEFDLFNSDHNLGALGV